MKREHEHSTIAEKFWDWWDYVELGELIVGGLAVSMILFLIVGVSTLIIVAVSTLRNADDLPPEEPAEGVAWIMPESGEAAVWLSPVCADDAETARMLDEYTEGDSPVPAWWNPEEKMAVEWEANAPQPDTVDYNAPEGIDPGGVDWNICTTLWGWDGHCMEVIEMECFARIAYLEFFGTSPECCEAGVDAILRLWESGYYGQTMLDTLSAETETGAPAFSTWDAVWTTDYDPDGLAEMRSLCEERFYNGPEWIAPFFRTGHYHDWAVPCYSFPEDNVYFSTAKGWQ